MYLQEYLNRCGDGEEHADELVKHGCPNCSKASPDAPATDHKVVPKMMREGAASEAPEFIMLDVTTLHSIVR